MKIVLEKKRDWNQQFSPFSHEPDLPIDRYFPIGTFKFVSELKKRLGHGMVQEDLNQFLWSNYAPKLGGNLLNSEYCILPASEIGRLRFQILGQFGEDCKIFIRPNRGDKPFDGQILDITEFNYFSSMYDSELTIISKPKKIIGEWRFAVCLDGILGYSLYKYQDNVVYVEACPPAMKVYVSEISKLILGDSLQYCVVDVAQLPDTSFKIIEINSLHHSGLYAMKPEPIVEFIEKLR